MTVDELLAREAIRHTLASYNVAGDRARADEFAEVFTEDGVLETGSFRQEGRERIRQWMSGAGRDPDAAPRAKAVSFVRHNITTCQIDITGPDTAKARTYYVVFTDIGPDHSGYYVDDFRRVGERWLISHRKARLDWRAPESTFGL